MAEVQIEASWKSLLSNQWKQKYFEDLVYFVKSQYQSTQVFPQPHNIFRAFNLCPLDKVKVVILGQDPYHGVGQANGLSFAVNSELALPPSLQNIFKEISADMGYIPLQDGDLSRWATQGVLLLNSVLTVQKSSPASHKNQGWEQFTTAVIRELSAHKKHVVYMLWGKYAQEKGLDIDRDNNFVLEAAHPSPYSATRFFGCKHFSQCNQYLQKNGIVAIDWH